MIGCVHQRCYENADCSAPKICNAVGRCVFECSVASDCGDGFDCTDHRCVPRSSQDLVCPSDMVAVAEAFCIDRYEASRPDAMASHAGQDDSRALSVAGVLPWEVTNNAEAADACEASGKRLCEPLEWQRACEGPDQLVYAYGNDYEPATCNGLDTYGLGGFRLMPTGAFPKCTNAWGAFDLNGNLWEHVAGGSERSIRGGAYNCMDSATYHRCDYIPGYWTPSARGFRCCLTPEGASASDPDSEGVEAPDVIEMVDVIEAVADALNEAGCLDEDAIEVADIDIVEAFVPDVLDSAVSPDIVAGCPAGMVGVGSFCIDPYEASRDDATAEFAGFSTTAACRPGVIPWYPVTLAQARTGCATMGKRLCRPDEWLEVCQGPSQSVYAYGDDYDPMACNGIDTFCFCDVGSCEALSQCPYPHCFNQASSLEAGGPCGAAFHVMPTGSFPRCTNVHGVFDLNGNVWELVDTIDGFEHFRGGAYNCSDSVMLHRCDYDAVWNPSGKGFRCCADREEP